MNGAPRWRIVLIGVLVLAAIIPAGGLWFAVEAARTLGLDDASFISFVGGIALLGGSAVVVGATILWQRPGNRIGSLLTAGGLLVMSASASWPVSVVLGARGDPLAAGLATWWGTIALLPGVALLFPAVGILFPDERLPGPRWAWPVRIGTALIAAGVVIQTIAPWSTTTDITVPNPLALAGVPGEAFQVGGDMAAVGTFVLLATAIVAVVVRYRRSAGLERAQQKWLVAALGVMGILLPLSFGPDVGPADLIDLLSVLAGSVVPVAIGIAVLRYHVFEIDRVVSRTIAYGLLTAVLVVTYAVLILLLQGPLGAVLGGDTISVALSTLVVAAIFQPLRNRMKVVVDRRFDRTRYDADRMTLEFAARLRNELDLETLREDLTATTTSAVAPRSAALWLRGTGT